MNAELKQIKVVVYRKRKELLKKFKTKELIFDISF
jgi:hypothetical protein